MFAYLTGADKERLVILLNKMDNVLNEQKATVGTVLCTCISLLNNSCNVAMKTIPNVKSNMSQEEFENRTKQIIDFIMEDLRLCLEATARLRIEAYRTGKTDEDILAESDLSLILFPKG